MSAKTGEKCLFILNILALMFVPCGCSMIMDNFKNSDADSDGDSDSDVDVDSDADHDFDDPADADDAEDGDTDVDESPDEDADTDDDPDVDIESDADVDADADEDEDIEIEYVCSSLGDIRVTSDSSDSRLPDITWNGTEYGVVWHDDRYGNYEIMFNAISDLGIVAGSDVRLTDSLGISINPVITWTGTEYGAVWADDREGNFRIYFGRFSSDGTLIGSDACVSENEAGTANYPSIMWTGTEFGVGWADNRDGGSEIFFRRISSAGTLVGSEVRVTDCIGNSRHTSLAWTGTEYGISWNDDSDGNIEIYFNRISDLGVLAGPCVRITDVSGVSEWSSLAWTGTEFGISWSDSRIGNNEIYFGLVSDAGVPVVTDTRTTNDPNNSLYPSLVWTGTGFGVCWQEDRDGNFEIYFRRISAGGMPEGPDVRITADGNVSRPPSLAWSGLEYGVAWADDRDGNYEIYFARIQCVEHVL